MRVLHVVDTLDLTRGGPPRVCYGLCKVLASLGHTVTLLAGGAQGWEQNDLSAQAARVSIVLPVGCHSLFSIGRDLLEEQDLVHFHGIWNPALTLLAYWCRRRGIPYVLTPHGYLDAWPMQQKALKKIVYFRLFERWMVQGSNALHFLNNDELTNVRKLGISGRFFLLPNGVDPREWSQLPPIGSFRQLHPEIGDKTMVLFMARLHHGKGPDLLTKAFADVSRLFPNSFLVLAGPDYGMKTELQRIIADRGIGDRVLLPGMVSGEERLALLQDADIFALPSYQEGHPMSVVEAAYMGKSLLITAPCHCDDLPHGIAAEVVPVTVEGVREGLERLIADKAYRQRLATAAGQIAREIYVWDSIGGRLSAHYEEIIHAEDTTLPVL